MGEVRQKPVTQKPILSKTILQKEGEIKTFLDNPKLNEFVPSILDLKEILKKDLQVEMRGN